MPKKTHVYKLLVAHEEAIISIELIREKFQKKKFDINSVVLLSINAYW